MYRFADLTDQQKHQRRELLDLYGFLAQVSVLVPLLVLQCFRVAGWAQARLFRKDDLQTPSSPYVKASRLGHGLNVPGIAARWRKFLWWFGDSVQYAGLHLGTKGEILGVGVWTLWLVALSFLQTGDGEIICYIRSERTKLSRAYRLSSSHETSWNRWSFSAAVPLPLVP